MRDKQTDRILSALRGSAWWTLSELSQQTDVEIDSLSGQLRNLRRAGYPINRRRRHKKTFEYSLGDDGPIESNGDEDQ